MDIVILNTSRLRVAIDKYVKKNNEHSMTDCFKRKNLNSSILSKSENRFVSSYKNKVTAEIDEYTTYGAMYSDVWQQIKNSFGFKAEDFEVERLPATSNSLTNGKALDRRISDLEEKYIVLAKIVEELRRKGE